MFAGNNFRFYFFTGFSKPFPYVGRRFNGDLLPDHGAQQRLKRIPASRKKSFRIGANDLGHDGISFGKLLLA